MNLLEETRVGCGAVLPAIEGAATPRERSARLEQWVFELHALWSAPHGAQIAAWFERSVLPEKI